MITKRILTISWLLLVFIGFYSCEQAAQKPDEFQAEHGQFTGIPAIDAITKDIIADPNNMALRVARCEAYSQEGMYTEAEEEARIIYDYDKTNWKSARLLAWTYLENNKSKPAIKTLEQALEIHPDTIHLLLVHSEINLNVKHYDEALISAEKVLKLSPLNVEGLFMRGLILKYIGDTLSSIGNFQTAIEQDADHIDAYMQLAHIFSAKKEKIALQYYDNALRIDSLSYEALKGKAAFFHQNYTKDNGMLEKTKEAYERLILHHPQEVNGCYDYGLFFMEEGDFEQAQHFFGIAVKYDPTFGEAYYFKGEALEKLGKIDEAVRAYENAVRNGNRYQRAEEALKRLGK
ncbi:tetratricopeptide repeat protein [Aureispira anguillae]|uniref:Tetratricopeptide repeat protein n=1 Tax=Aureispira anguillae TaxID=2864201 RepID=A0A915YJ58_9BACT|nr:tetratricopeptide repeat protein [Aureispira anguillae]BDS13957.1 tetratricopeptide repeat protein [Aureispira anguillae]